MTDIREEASTVTTTDGKEDSPVNDELTFIPLPGRQPGEQPPTEPDNPLSLTPAEKRALVLVIAAALGVSVLGLYSSYGALTVKAAQWGWHSTWVLPIGVDLAIPAFTGLGLFLIRTDMPLAWVPWAPRALTAATVYLNWTAGSALAGRIGHAVLILLWVVFSEIAGHVYATRIGAVTGKRMEKVRRARWVLAPISTALLERRRILWEITSYAEALRRERDRLLVRAELRERHGRLWRWRAPRRERVLLRVGELAPESLSALAQEPEASAAGAQDERAQEPAGAPTPAAQEGAQTSAQAGRRERAHRPTTRANGVSAKGSKHARKSAAKKTLNERRTERVRALYGELGKRPEWTEIRDALTAAKLSAVPVSRPTAQRIRERVEKVEPELAALGSDNVHPLTGS